jgi:hypothetical protein
MAKQQNDVKTKQKTVSLADGVCVYLDDLAELNTYGKNTTEIAGRLIDQQIEILIEKKVLKRRKFKNSRSVPA